MELIFKDPFVVFGENNSLTLRSIEELLFREGDRPISKPDCPLSPGPGYRSFTCRNSYQWMRAFEI